MFTSWLLLSKASLGPYAWQHKPTKRLRSMAVPSKPEEERCEQHNLLPLEDENQTRGKTGHCTHHWWKLYPDLRNLPRSDDVFQKIEQHPCLSLQLPKAGATAGQVLDHANVLFERLQKKHQPWTFKFGISHDASMRWENPVFGYKYSKDPFDEMLIIFASSNPHGPAFLEAALIQSFGGLLS